MTDGPYDWVVAEAKKIKDAEYEKKFRAFKNSVEYENCIKRIMDENHVGRKEAEELASYARAVYLTSLIIATIIVVASKVK